MQPHIHPYYSPSSLSLDGSFSNSYEPPGHSPACACSSAPSSKKSPRIFSKCASCKATAAEFSKAPGTSILRTHYIDSKEEPMIGDLYIPYWYLNCLALGLRRAWGGLAFLQHCESSTNWALQLQRFPEIEHTSLDFFFDDLFPPKPSLTGKF